MYENLDNVLNQQIRLAIISILIKVQSADFNFLKESTKTTQGNLSHQLKKLKEAEYIEINKKFVNNYPKTICRITNKGKSAFENYVEQMKFYLNLRK
jgi:DNA-binding HxlR family transcriptional regulator